MELNRRGLFTGTAASALLAAWPALAQVVLTPPDRVGVSAAGMAQLDVAMHALVEQKALCGVVTLVARKGKVVHLDAYGRQNLDEPAPMRTDSIFRIASMTKPTIGAGMMMLFDEGRWALDDPVAKYIPGFRDLKVRTPSGALVPQASPMTMRQIMSQTAGIGHDADYEQYNWRPGDNGTLQDMIDTLSTLPLYYQPGTAWRYGPSVNVQGYLIEKLSGQSLDVFMRERLFGPLGMVDTGFWVDPAKLDRVTGVNAYKDGVLTQVAPGRAILSHRPTFLAGSGALVSTAPDYVRFCQMILNGGQFEGRRYLKPASVKLMHTNVLAPGINVTLYSPDTRGLGFGLDFAIVQDPAAAKTRLPAETFYWMGALGTWFWIDPVNEVIFVGMIQNQNGSSPYKGTPPMRETTAKIVYDSLGNSRG